MLGCSIPLHYLAFFRIRALLKSGYLTSHSQLPTKCPEGSSVNTTLLWKKDRGPRTNWLWSEPRSACLTTQSRAPLITLRKPPSSDHNSSVPYIALTHYLSPLLTSCLVHANYRRQNQQLLRPKLVHVEYLTRSVHVGEDSCTLVAPPPCRPCHWCLLNLRSNLTETSLIPLVCML